MTDIYIEGTGAIKYAGKPKLSAVAQALVKLVHLYDRQDGFYRQDNENVDVDDIRDAVIDTVLPEHAEAGRLLAGDELVAFLDQKNIPLAESYLDLLQTEDPTPLDVMVAILKDPESNLRHLSYEEAFWCNKPRQGEFGGYGAFFSDRVVMHYSTNSATMAAENLDRALRGEGSVTAEQLVVAGITGLLSQVVDLEKRGTIAKAILQGEALKAVEDTIVNESEEVE